MAVNIPDFWLIVPAAGNGSRMESEIPKQYLELAGRSVLETTLEAFLDHPSLLGVVLVLQPGDRHFGDSSMRPHEKIRYAAGGSERRHSVLNGLRSLQAGVKEDDWVLVHDAVRPCITRADIDNLLGTLADDAVGGILAREISDTLKEADADKRITATLDRAHYYLAATPQMFRFQVLLDALLEAESRRLAVTDEAAAVEAGGKTVHLVPGRNDNIKITRREDLALAEFILTQRDERKDT